MGMAPLCVPNAPLHPISSAASQAVLDYMKSYRNTKDYFTYISSSVYWAGAYMLAYLLVTEGRPVVWTAGHRLTIGDRQACSRAAPVGRWTLMSKLAMQCWRNTRFVCVIGALAVHSW
jgi:hypothetical protein